jgi:capsular exopolysaccharide synthesis family protein
MILSLPPDDRPRQASVMVGSPRPNGLHSYSLDPAEPAAPEPLDWRRVWAAVRRWKWLVSGVVVAGTLAGVLATRWLKPSYRAQATIWIDSRDRREAGPAPFQPGRLLDPEAWLDLMRSYAVLDDVARSERLYLHLPPKTPPALVAGFQVADTFRYGAYQVSADGASYRLETDDGIELDRVSAGDSLGRRLGFRWAPPAGVLGEGGSVRFEVSSLRDASSQLSDRLQLHIDPEGNLLRVELEGTDRDRLVSVLDRVADRYVAVAGDLKRQKLTELTGILSDQLASATNDLVSAESTYQTFRTRTITLPSERQAVGGAAIASTAGAAGPDPVSDRYFALRTSRGTLTRDREAIERAIGNGGDDLSIEALNLVPSARESRALGPALDELATRETELRGLRARYSDAHPEVIQLTERIRTLKSTTIPSLARSLTNELRVREGLTRRDEASAGADLRGIPARSLEEARLRRAVSLAEDLHNTLQQRHEEARLAVASSIPDARVLDRAAVPRNPVRDTAVRVIALAFLASLGLGLAAAVMLDRVDPRFRYPSQISRELGLPILGAIPHVQGIRRHLHEGQDRSVAPLIEALRGIRMSVLTAAPDADPLLLAISSPGSGDGKSFVASHLAFAFAEAGYRTLLIDGDSRRGRLNQRFGIPRRPGLCDVLLGTTSLDDALKPTDYADLTILPCGTRAHHAPELLGGPGMAVLMADLRRRFQVIICDTPPLSAGIDPYVLAVATGRLLLVLRTGISHREMMTAKLSVIERMPIDLLGVVMNDVPPDATYGYYSYYLAGYEAGDETPAVTAGP